MVVGIVLIAIFVVMAIVAIGVIVYLVGINNELVALKNTIDRSFADIDVILKQRHDELPKLVDTCKGYMQYEQKTLQAVTDARTSYMRATTPAEKTQADGMVTGALKTLFAVAENYPDLKASTNFIELQRELTDTEDKIQAARRFYNGNVRDLNTKIEVFPTNIVASIFSFKEMALFEVAGDQEREAPKVSFENK